VTTAPAAGDGDRPFCPRCGADALQQRADDRENVVRNRLDVYRELTLPAVDVLGARYPLRRVDGVGEPQAVARRIASALG